jgi:S-adenosylmethionine hydrolase
VDITHQLPAHDVRAGALTLWRAIPWLVPGVVLGVVDPGVGTSRRAVAIEVGGAGAVLVGPDNGLLLPAATSLGPITDAVELARDRHGRPGTGATFAGRDLFAPVCADLARGVGLRRLGQGIDPAGLTGAPVPAPVADSEGSLRTEVLWVDRFGNAQLNARPDDADRLDLGPVVDLEVHQQSWPARRVAAYAELSAGELGLVTDSYGLLAVSGHNSSAAAVVGLRPGDQVWLRRPVEG